MQMYENVQIKVNYPQSEVLHVDPEKYENDNVSH